MRFPFFVAVLTLTGATGLAAATDATGLADLALTVPAPGDLPLADAIALVDAAQTSVREAPAAAFPTLAAPAGAEARADPARDAGERVVDRLVFQLLPDGLLVLDLTGATPADATPLGAVMLRAPAAQATPAPTLARAEAPASGPAPAPTAQPGPGPAAPTQGPARAVAVQSVAAPEPNAAQRLPATLVAGSIAASLVGFAGASLYHRIRPHAALENDTRKVIFEAVCAQPGLGVHAIAKTAGVSYSTATYHLERLVGAGMLVMTPDGNKLCYYKNGGAFTETERRILPLLKNDEASRLLEAILARPGTYRAELAEQLGVTATTINWHLKRLREAGLVDETRQGRNAYLRARVGELRGSLDSLAQKIGESDPLVVARLRRYTGETGATLAGGA